MSTYLKEVRSYLLHIVDEIEEDAANPMTDYLEASSLRQEANLYKSIIENITECLELERKKHDDRKYNSPI